MLTSSFLPSRDYFLKPNLFCNCSGGEVATALLVGILKDFDLNIGVNRLILAPPIVRGRILADIGLSIMALLLAEPFNSESYTRISVPCRFSGTLTDLRTLLSCEFSDWSRPIWGSPDSWEAAESLCSMVWVIYVSVLWKPTCCRELAESIPIVCVLTMVTPSRMLKVPKSIEPGSSASSEVSDSEFPDYSWWIYTFLVDFLNLKVSLFSI